MRLQNARGVRDIPPKEQSQRQAIIRKLQETFEKYGFVPLDTPIIERYDVLSAKFAAGEESDAMSETYRLKDNGGRELGLRFDLTVPLARFVGMNLGLKMPFKRYQIGKVYRDAPVKEGRYREFTQCDADIIGSKNMISDATCATLAIDFYRSIGLDVVVKINNRKVLQGIISELGVKKEQFESAMITIDKLDKYGREAVEKELKEKDIEIDLKKFLELTPGTCSLAEKERLKKEFLEPLERSLGEENEGLKELTELFSYLDNSKSIIFDPALARGLGYYTGTVFEVYSKENPSIGAIGAGGRYDNLIGGYLDQPEGAYPAVGISFGLDRIMDVLKKLGKKTEEQGSAEIFIIPIGATIKESFKIAQELRAKGIRTDIDLAGRSLSKNIKYADTLSIPRVLFVGEDEIKKGLFKLRDLKTGEETIGSVDELFANAGLQTKHL